MIPVKADRSDLVVSMQEWGVLKEQCSMLVKSGFLPNSIKTTEQAIAIALKGRELGIPPMQAFGQINVIQGKPAISSELMLALIFRNVPNAKVEFERYEADGCTILATRPGHKPARFTFNAKDAEAAGLTGKDNWKKYPRAMYRSRAISEMARSVFPDAIMGCSYTPEEMGANVNEDGEVIDVTPAPLKYAPGVPPLPEGPLNAELAECLKQPATKPGYDGSPEQQKILQNMLKHRKVPEEQWERVHEAMLGKNLPDLANVLKDIAQ